MKLETLAARRTRSEDTTAFTSRLSMAGEVVPAYLVSFRLAKLTPPAVSRALQGALLKLTFYNTSKTTKDG